MVKSMKPGAVIVDLAVEAGGNCPLSELGKVVVRDGVKIVGHDNVPGRLAEDASHLFARNLLNFITPLVDTDSKTLMIDWEDEIITGTLVCRDGRLVHPRLADASVKKPAAKAKTSKPAKAESTTAEAESATESKGE